MTYKLYYSPGACSVAAHAVLRRIGCSFELVKIDTRKEEQRTPAYLRINPHGRVPVLATSDGNISELIAILLFLAEQHPDVHLLPQAAANRAECLTWMSYLQSTIHPFFGALWRSRRFAEDPAAHPAIIATVRERLREEFASVEAALGDRRWLLGQQMYLCDYNLFALARWAPAVADLAQEFPHIASFVHRMGEEAAVAEVLENEGIPLFRKNL